MTNIVSTLPIEICQAPSKARNYILATWLSSYRKSRWVEGVESAVYYARQREVVEALLQRQHFKVARWLENPDHLYGWICYGGDQGNVIVHYCYIGEKYRKLGIGRALLESIPWYTPGDRVIATHYSQIVSPVFEKLFKVENDPYLLRGLNEDH